MTSRMAADSWPAVPLLDSVECKNPRVSQAFSGLSWTAPILIWRDLDWSCEHRGSEDRTTMDRRAVAEILIGSTINPTDATRWITTQVSWGFMTYVEAADVKSPHMSVLGWAAGTGGPKSKRRAGLKEGGLRIKTFKRGFLESIPLKWRIITSIGLCHWDCLLSPRRGDKTPSLCTRWRRK